MKAKILLLCSLLSLSIIGCSSTETTNAIDETSDTLSPENEDYDELFDIESIESDIKSHILSDKYPPSELSIVNLSSHYCYISIDWNDSLDIFLEQCYYAIPEISNVLNIYQYEYDTICFQSAVSNDSSKLTTLTYYSDENIKLLDAISNESRLVSYTYEDLVTSTKNELYSDNFVSFEYDKNLFTVEPSDGDTFLTVSCPAMPKEPQGSHNTVMFFVTQTHDSFADFSQEEAQTILEGISKNISHDLFKLNEGETIINEETKYSDYCAEYNIESSDGSKCYVKTLNYNSHITTAILRICEYSEPYNDSLLDIYDSAKSELGNYDFNKKTESYAQEEGSDQESAEKIEQEDNSSSGSSSLSPSIQGSDSVINPDATGNSENFNTYDNAEQQQTSNNYVLNTSTHKIHYPGCNDVKKIAPDNYSTSSQPLDELINQGYTTCGHCFR